MKTCVSLMLGILGSLATLASSADIISDGLNMLPTTGDYFLYDTLKEAVATASPLLSFPLRLSPGLFRFTGEISTVGMKCPGVGVKFRLILKDLSPDVCTLQGYNLRQKRAVIMREMELDNGQYEVLNSNDANVFELPISTDGFRSSFSTVIKIDGVEDEQREATLELVAEPEAWKEGNECLSSESYPIVSLGHLRFSEVDEALSDIPCGQSMISFQHDPTKHILPYRFGKTLLGGSRPTILSKNSLLLKETEPYQIQFVVPVVPKRKYQISFLAVFPSLSEDELAAVGIADYYTISIPNINFIRRIIPSSSPVKISAEFEVDSKFESLVITLGHAWRQGQTGLEGTEMRIENFQFVEVCDTRMYLPRTVRIPACKARMTENSNLPTESFTASEENSGNSGSPQLSVRTHLTPVPEQVDLRDSDRIGVRSVNEQLDHDGLEKEEL